jgi:hypothetical protein
MGIGLQYEAHWHGNLTSSSSMVAKYQSSSMQKRTYKFTDSDMIQNMYAALTGPTDAGNS